MNIIIVGGGNTLYFLSRNFTSKGYKITIINRNKVECVQLARQLKATVIHGDGSDVNILKEAGAIGTDIVLAITPNDQDNLVICQISMLEFGVPRAMALANDPDNVRVFNDLGIPTFSTTHIVSSLIEQRASMDQITNLLPLSDGQVNVTEIIIDEKSPVRNIPLKDINLPDNALISIIIRNNSPIVPRGGNKLMTGDKIVLITLPENHGPVLKMFSSESK
ncbi:TPA: potassium transporter TrkA [Candidatus Marinimicrobia bacterium]|nr:potassium transporter TrkA [Candidatus Neomarinimicrobiota bacterium]